MNFSFGALFGGGPSAAPNGVAVAGYDTAQCSVPPLFICNPNEPGPFDPSTLVGVGITLKEASGGGLGPGDFGLLGLDPFTGGASGLNEIRDAWARVNPMTLCLASIVETQPGQLTAVRQGLNMRFDVFPTGVHQVPAGEPPVQSNPQYTPSLNSVKGMLRAGAQCSVHPQGWGNATQPFTGTNPPVPSEMGFPRDSCAYGGACDTALGGTNIGDGVWDVTSYMQVNHGGASPAVVPDLDGNGVITRYELYDWELNNTLASGEPEPMPVCHSSTWQPPRDRRFINAAVLNCAALGGLTVANPIAWVDLFLTEPMGVFSGNNDLYSEVIGPGENSGGGVTRHIVHLVE